MRLNLSFQKIWYEWHIQKDSLLRILKHFYLLIRCVQRLQTKFTHHNHAKLPQRLPYFAYDN